MMEPEGSRGGHVGPPPSMPSVLLFSIFFLLGSRLLVAAPILIKNMSHSPLHIFRAGKIGARTMDIFRFAQPIPSAIQAGVHHASRPVSMKWHIVRTSFMGPSRKSTGHKKT